MIGSNVVILFSKSNDQSPKIIFSENNLDREKCDVFSADLNKEGINSLFNKIEIHNCPIIVNKRFSSQESKEIILVWHPIATIVLEKQFTTQNSINALHEDTFTFKDWNKIPSTVDSIGKKILKPFIENENVYNLVLSYIGIYGYISYEASRHLEKFKYREDIELIPTLYFTFPSRYLIERENEWLYIELDGELIKPRDYNLNLPQSCEQLTSNLELNEYITKVQSVIDHVHAGEIYQANITQQFIIKAPSINPRVIFNQLILRHNVPYFSYLEFSNFNIISLSPELFLSVSKGIVTTKPIKGTRSRGHSIDEDRELASELLGSEKDQAELAMIVDLLRNDLGKSSKGGSVIVKNHAKLESYSNVHHLVSTITSEIPVNIENSWRLLLRAFPGGSITGCPKIRAMEIIESLENTPRGVYTGCIGFLLLNGDMEFNIAIRTMVFDEKTLIFNSGGGIVADSIPHDEYIESLHKAKHFASFFNKSFTGRIFWLNNNFFSKKNIINHIVEDKLRNGFFETILVENSEIKNIKYHWQRLDRGIKHFQINATIPSIQVLKKLVMLNIAETAKLKILISISTSNVIDVLCYIQPYNISTKPVDLLLANNPFVPDDVVNFGIKHLKNEKYTKATKTATNKGYWDMLLYNEANQILETGRANIYIYSDRWYTPSQNVIHGTIRSKLISKEIVTLGDLTINNLNNAKAIAISNALNGVRVVNKIIQQDTNKIIWKTRKLSKSKYLVSILQESL